MHVCMYVFSSPFSFPAELHTLGEPARFGRARAKTRAKTRQDSPRTSTIPCVAGKKRQQTQLLRIWQIDVQRKYSSRDLERNFASQPPAFTARHKKSLALTQTFRHLDRGRGTALCGSRLKSHGYESGPSVIGYREARPCQARVARTLYSCRRVEWVHGTRRGEGSRECRPGDAKNVMLCYVQRAEG